MRGLVFLRPLPQVEPAEMRFEALCDCGQFTELILVPQQAPDWTAAVPAEQEIAFSCENCASTHWLTIKSQLTIRADR